MPIVAGNVEKMPTASFMPKTSSPFSLRELDAARHGMPNRVPSATSFMALFQAASFEGGRLSRRMKWRRCSRSIASVVGSTSRVAKMLVPASIVRSSRTPPCDVSPPSGTAKPVNRVLMSMSPTFSSSVMRPTRSAARSAGARRQSSWASRRPLPFRSLKLSPSASIRLFVRTCRRGCCMGTSSSRRRNGSG